MSQKSSNHTDTDERFFGPPLFFRLALALLTVGLVWNGLAYMTDQNVLMASVNGSSMNYELLTNQRVMIEKDNPPTIERGNVVAFDANAEDPLNPRIDQATANGESVQYVKRIIGLPGDTVEGREDGIYVNGERLNEPYIANEFKHVAIPWTLESLSNSSLWADEKDPSHIPDNHVFVLGDNRKVSEDSRYFGFVHIDNILGDVETLPWNDQPTIPQSP